MAKETRKKTTTKKEKNIEKVRSSLKTGAKKYKKNNNNRNIKTNKKIVLYSNSTNNVSDNQKVIEVKDNTINDDKEFVQRIERTIKVKKKVLKAIDALPKTDVDKDISDDKRNVEVKNDLINENSFEQENHTEINDDKEFVQRIERTSKIKKKVLKVEEKDKNDEDTKIVENSLSEEKKEDDNKPKKNIFKYIACIFINGDNDFPLGNEKDDKRKRTKKYLKESIFLAIIITLSNVISMKLFSYVNYFKIFDVKWVNIVLTVVLSLLFSYVCALFWDSLISEIWVKIKSRKQEGVLDGDKRIKEGKHRKDIEV